MQVHDANKRRRIIEAAGKLFAQRQFHKVCLEEVASEAGVGKGTVYTYFTSKDDLYLSLLEHALGELVDRLERQIDGNEQSAEDRLALIIRELVDYAIRHPYLFELMRSGMTPLNRSEWDQRRQALRALIERVIRQGVKEKRFDDPHPDLSALFIPGMVRSAMLGIARQGTTIDRQQLGEHVLRFVNHGLAAKEAK